MSSSSFSNPVFWSKFAQPSRPFVGEKPVGIDIGTLETITFQVASEAARRSFSHVHDLVVVPDADVVRAGEESLLGRIGAGVPYRQCDQKVGR